MLLAAVDIERASGVQMSEMQLQAQEVARRINSGQHISIQAGQLGEANRAATAIQKVVRGNAARKE